MLSIIRVAVRYLRGHFHRYLFVILVLVLGFAFITVTSSLSDGMRHSITHAALRHYAGHIFIMGRDGDAGSMMVVDHPALVEKAIDRAGVPVERMIFRTIEHNDATLFFHGDTVRLKDLFGVDFRAEADLFRSFEYVEGGFDASWDKDSIIISEPTAKQLKAREGDRITARLLNRDRQVDTRTLIVRAVTADASIYGYARAYVARETLSSLMALSPAEYSVVGIFIPDSSEAFWWARRIHTELESLLPVSGLIESKEALTANIREKWDGVRYFTFALPVYISEVTELLAAMEIGSYVLLSMIILVVLAGALVTYRVVLHERTGEIGTMLALGFPRIWIVGMLVIESVILLCSCMGIGAVLSFGINYIVSLLSFDWLPGFEIFMEGGKLTARYTSQSVMTNVFIILTAVLPVITIMAGSIVFKPIPSLIKGEPV